MHDNTKTRPGADIGGGKGLIVKFVVLRRGSPFLGSREFRRYLVGAVEGLGAGGPDGTWFLAVSPVAELAAYLQFGGARDHHRWGPASWQAKDGTGGGSFEENFRSMVLCLLLL